MELVGDPCIPSMLIVPEDANPTTISGAGILFLSGSKLHFHTGTTTEMITSVG